MFKLIIEITYKNDLNKVKFDERQIKERLSKEDLNKIMINYTEKMSLGFIDKVNFHVLTYDGIIDLS